MQYMGWSWFDLMTCPEDILTTIYDIAKKDAAEQRAAGKRPATRPRRR